MPGHMGTLDFSANSLATSLFPIERIVSGFGPIQVIWLSITSWAKESFSERNPNPGCTASALVSIAAFIIFLNAR